MPMAILIASSSHSFAVTAALLVTFLGIGVLVNVLIVYVIAQVMAERKQNRENNQRV